MGYGVIGNTAGFDPAIIGSSPIILTKYIMSILISYSYRYNKRRYTKDFKTLE